MPGRFRTGSRPSRTYSMHRQVSFPFLTSRKRHHPLLPWIAMFGYFPPESEMHRILLLSAAAKLPHRRLLWHGAPAGLAAAQKLLWLAIPTGAVLEEGGTLPAAMHRGQNRLRTMLVLSGSCIGPPGLCNRRLLCLLCNAAPSLMWKRYEALGFRTLELCLKCCLFVHGSSRGR